MELEMGEIAIGRRHFLGLAVGVAGICAGCAPPDGRLGQVGRNHVLFGAWVPGGAEAARVLETELGRPLDVEHWYQGWGAEPNDSISTAPVT